MYREWQRQTGRGQAAVRTKNYLTASGTETWMYWTENSEHRTGLLLRNETSEQQVVWSPGLLPVSPHYNIASAGPRAPVSHCYQHHNSCGNSATNHNPRLSPGLVWSAVKNPISRSRSPTVTQYVQFIFSIRFSPTFKTNLFIYYLLKTHGTNLNEFGKQQQHFQELAINHRCTYSYSIGELQ